ncbi:MAG: TonB-dependent receptor [Sphingomonadaceae bacterium]|nr:TonB-dependent receptor [Sphingomonadaceae bacterium]
MTHTDIRARIGLLLTASLMSIGTATAASAQTADATAAAADTGLAVEEIVVTAQRREQKLQDVPIAVTAFGQDFLEDRNVTSFAGIQGFTPNVKIVVTNRNSAPAISMRGSVTINPAPSFEPTVALYLDGVYLSKQYGSLVDNADIDHIEVLRGPQGTLFGRNTLAGAINIVSRKPTGELGGSLKVGTGNYGSQLLRGSVDLPAFGNLSVKLSGSYTGHDGYVKVAPTPFTAIVPRAGAAQAREFQSESHKAFRVAARYQADPNFTVDYTYDFSRADDTMGFSQPTFFSPGGIFDPASPTYQGGLNPATGVYAGNPLNLYVFPNERSKFGYQGNAFPKAITGKNPLEEDTENQLHALTLTWDVGPLTLKSISSYRDLYHAWSNDTDGVPLNLLTSALTMDYESKSQEFQATGSAGDFSYTAGLYYFDDDGSAYNPQQFFGGALSIGGYGFKTKAYAAYGQLEFTPSALPQLTLIAGLRYSDEEKQTSRYVNSVNATTGVITPVIPVGTGAKASFDSLTPAFTAKYDLTDDVNVYARYAKGFKSGGFNGDAGNALEAVTPFKPETVSSYEIGAKGRFLDGRLQTNFAAFWDRHTDMQLSVFLGQGTLASGIRNAGKADIKGIELEVQAIPAEWLKIGGSLGTLNADYKEFIDAGVNVANDRAFPYTPKMTASGNVDLRLLEGDWGRARLLIDYVHSDSYYIYPYTTRVDYSGNTAATTRADSSDIFDVRFLVDRIETGKGTVEASLWVKNVFDSSDRVSGIDFGASFGHATVSYYNPPRTYGADLTFRF